MAVSYLLTPDQRRQRDRDDALAEALATTVYERGLSAATEAEYWQAARRELDRVMERTDAAVAARVALEAHDQRIDRHMQQHRTCVLRQECSVYRSLVRQYCRLQRESDQRIRELLGGRP